MRFTKLTAAVMFVVLAGCADIPFPLPTPPPPAPPGDGYDCDAQPALSGLVKVANAVAGRYIVILKPRSTSTRPETHVAVYLRHAAEMGVALVQPTSRGYAATVSAQALQRLLADPNVLYVQEDGVKKIIATSWGLDRIDQRDLPLDGKYTPGADGAGVNVVIVDTGISPHPDFGDRLQTDCFSAYAACTDGHGHGTHVAGSVGGTAWGVAKKVKLYASRVLDANGSGSDSSVVRGIEWVTAKKQASPSEDWIINMSLGGDDSPALNRATCDAIAAGVTVVVAAGNSEEDADRSSPARVKQAITVGASDKTDKQASFSNFGKLLDLYGPGVDIESTKPGGGTATYSGTSMASPHVAGAAALYLERHPRSSPQAVEDGLVLYSTREKIVNPGPGSPNRLLYVKED
jgi:subtilisin family serine protease